MSANPSTAPAVLCRAEPPWVWRLEAAVGSAYEVAWRWAEAGLTSRLLRGAKMRTEASCFDEFGAALQFPDYFGENWPALDECLADLSWLPGRSYVFVITDADQVLAEEPQVRFDLLLDVIGRAATTWAEPVTAGETWDRPAVPLHVVLHSTASNAGALAGRFEPAAPPPLLT
jgi:hypothetical protein